jgi:hypothetical protein
MADDPLGLVFSAIHDPLVALEKRLGRYDADLMWLCAVLDFYRPLFPLPPIERAARHIAAALQAMAEQRHLPRPVITPASLTRLATEGVERATQLIELSGWTLEHVDGERVWMAPEPRDALASAPEVPHGG